MAPPRDVMEFVHPGPPHFPFNGWALDFGKYNWFYLAGAKDAVFNAHIFDVSIPCDRASEAPMLVPDSWKHCHPSGEWDKLSKNQVRRAMDADPVCFEKACLAAIAIEQAVNGKLEQPAAVYKMLQIRPALFAIEGFTLDFLEADILPHPQRVADMMAASGQRKRQVFEQMADGYCVTYRTAEAIHTYLTTTLRYSCIGQIYTISTRRNNKKKPAPAETVSIG